MAKEHFSASVSRVPWGYEITQVSLKHVHAKATFSVFCTLTLHYQKPHSSMNCTLCACAHRVGMYTVYTFA